MPTALSVVSAGVPRTGRTGGGALLAAAALLGCLLLAGCGAARGPAPAAAPERAGLTGPADRERLATLASARARLGRDEGYRIGADDLLVIRIPDLLDTADSGLRSWRSPGASVEGSPLFDQGVRVAATGDVSLPLLGTVAAEGRTPRELEAEIAQRLIDAGILRAPQVSVSVAEYRSAVVAVIGSVQRPGLYPLTRPGAPLFDRVGPAGAPTLDAGRLVDFVPATAPGESPEPPIRLDLEALTRASGRPAPTLDPLVVPGDVISIAPAGRVQVDGWVDKPGSYPITRGLTVTGAVAAAGGQLFAADRRQATLSRPAGVDGPQRFTVDLDAVARGEGEDLPIIDGDVVHLPAAPARLVPWAVWMVARDLVHVGGSVLLF
jgi:polysaccharide export outer membrane protein